MNDFFNDEHFKNLIFSSNEDNAEFIPIISEDDEENLNDVEIPDALPVLPLRNTVLFPGVILPISIGREKSLELIKDIYNGSKHLGTIAQKDAEIDEPGIKDLYQVGTLGKIMKIFEMPDGSTSAIIQGKRRFEVTKVISDQPYFRINTKPLNEEKPPAKDKEYEAIVSSLKDMSIKIIQLSANIPQEASFALKNIENPSFLINFICSNSDIGLKEKQNLLEINNLKERGILLLEYLAKEVQMLELKYDIQSKVKNDIDQQQREYLLQQQMKTIQNELGGNPVEKEVEALRKKAEGKKWSQEVEAIFEKEIEKLQRLNPAVAEYSVQVNYLQTLLELPWNEYTNDNFDIQNAQKILDRDHSGLEKVKDRIVEHLAVLKLKGDLKSPILCLYGPPGVGKTSLGRSVAEALNRKYIRMSLGGLHDESEIRGHRRTYIGAMPGRIIQNIKKVQSSNPVFILDEIDKVGNDFRGDPASALLEVLDPEQNSTFHDNFLDIDFDLSHVLFIATANTLSTIRPALLDRMEIINVSGYVVEEKIEIAKKHLIPRQMENHGLKKNQVRFSKKVLEHMIENYTMESGVRELDKKIAKVLRSAAKKIASGEAFNPSIPLGELKNILGPPEYMREKYQGNEYIGVVTGLSWTAVGGQILFVETSLSKGEGKLTLTGNLGDVMKESATIALEVLKANAEKWNIEADKFQKHNIHLHVPEGAIPKDGPSAGITMATSLASAFTGRKVKKNLAMTGEITLRGKILPVGGIKEKILAAKRSNITEIILSEENKKDIEEIKDIYIQGITFHYIKNINQVLDISLEKEKPEKKKQEKESHHQKVAAKAS